MITDGNLLRVYRSHRGTQRRQNRESDWSGRRSFPGEFSGCSQDVLRPGSAISYLDTRVRHLLVSTNHEYVSFLGNNNNSESGFERIQSDSIGSASLLRYKQFVIQREGNGRSALRDGLRDLRRDDALRVAILIYYRMYFNFDNEFRHCVSLAPRCTLIKVGRLRSLLTREIKIHDISFCFWSVVVARACRIFRASVFFGVSFFFFFFFLLETRCASYHDPLLEANQFHG